MSDSTGTSGDNSHATENVNGEIDPEWENYWNKLIDDTIILVGLLMLKASLSKSDYKDGVRKKIGERIKRLILKYDEPFRRQKEYNK